MFAHQKPLYQVVLCRHRWSRAFPALHSSSQVDPTLQSEIAHPEQPISSSNSNPARRGSNEPKLRSPLSGMRAYTSGMRA